MFTWTWESAPFLCLTGVLGFLLFLTCCPSSPLRVQLPMEERPRMSSGAGTSPRLSTAPGTGEALPTSCPLPSFRGPRPLWECVPPTTLVGPYKTATWGLLARDSGGPGLGQASRLRNGVSGTASQLCPPPPAAPPPGRGRAALGPMTSSITPSAPEWGRKPLMQSPPPSPRHPRGTQIAKGL